MGRAILPNIWLEAPSGRVKILDFGMARSQREDVEIRRSGEVMGTPAYMAPEQARGEPAGAGSDLFSLGCVLYRLCTLRLPFEGNSVIAVLTSIATETPPAPRDLNDRIPASLSDLVMKLLHKMPEARPVSADVVVEELLSRSRVFSRVSTYLLRKPRPDVVCRTARRFPSTTSRRPRNSPGMRERWPIMDRPPASPTTGERRSDLTELREKGNWGDAVDPDRDCIFELDRRENKVRISVPGKTHILSAEIGRVNAPRILRDTKGEFDVSVQFAASFFNLTNERLTRGPRPCVSRSNFWYW